MRVVILTVALFLGAAETASAEFFPIQPPPPPPPCLLTPGQPNPPNVQVDCFYYPAVTLTQPSQLRLMVAFKVRAVWGSDAARHIARYGCGTFNLASGRSTVCAVRFRTRRGHVVTRRIRLAFVTSGSYGVLVSRVPPYPVPQTPIPTTGTGTDGPTQVSDG